MNQQVLAGRETTPASTSRPVSTPEYKVALKRARRGAKFLDKKLGRGWRRKIRRRKLKMEAAVHRSDGCGCVLAQLYEDYWFGLRELGLWSAHSRHKSLGFDADHGRGLSYDDLTTAWREVLREKEPA